MALSSRCSLIEVEPYLRPTQKPAFPSANHGCKFVFTTFLPCSILRSISARRHLEFAVVLSAVSKQGSQMGEKGEDGKADYGAFIEKFVLSPPPESDATQLHLQGLKFAVKDIFDVKGYVTGFGNPDWARTHEAAIVTSPVVLAIIGAGATCMGKTIMDEMAYSINGENKHYGTPTNPRAPERIPGGSSSGSAVAVAAKLVDFSLGTDTGGSVRVPAAFCGIFGFRPSHDVVSTSGVVPMAQSFDTVGWFARDAVILNQVGHVLLPLSDVVPVHASSVMIADDCFQLLNFPSDLLIRSLETLLGSQVIKHVNLGEYINRKVPSLNYFKPKSVEPRESTIPSLMLLSIAMRQLQRYEFKNNHGDWVNAVKPDLGPGIRERVWEALRTTEEDTYFCHTVKSELKAALSALLENHGILVFPTVPGPPPKLHTEGTTLEAFRANAFSLLAISGVSGFCQVNIPLGMHSDLPVSVSLLAKSGMDRFLLNFVKSLYEK